MCQGSCCHTGIDRAGRPSRVADVAGQFREDARTPAGTVRDRQCAKKGGMSGENQREVSERRKSS